MRVKVQKRNTPQQQPPQDVTTTSKMQEVTVTQHYHPNPMRKTMGNFPKVRYSSELPEEEKYHNLQSVFKFVDNFLSGTSAGDVKPHSPSRAPGGKNAMCKPVPKSICIPGKSPVRSVGRESVAKNVVRKPTAGSLAVHGTTASDKVERVKTNVNNIMKRNPMRVSLKRARCSTCHLDNGNCNRTCKSTPPPSPTEKSQFQTKKPPSNSDSEYVKHLKDEIKANKPQVCSLKTNVKYSRLTSPRDDYVKKLKDEVACNRSKCVDEARTTIQELQEEILNYRLKAKTKYSSSCSEIRSCDKTLLSSTNQFVSPAKSPEKVPFERRQIGESPMAVHHKQSDSPENGSPRLSKPCEALWESKKPQLPSTEFCTFPVTQEIYFEEKLQEANTLIEKVRVALRDIGMGMPKVLEQVDPNTENEKPQPSPESKCAKSCSYHGECNHRKMDDGNKERDGRNDAKSREISEERKSRSLNDLQGSADTVKLTKFKDENVQIIVEKLKTKEIQSASSSEKKESDRAIRESCVCEEVKQEKESEKKEVVIITIQAAKKTVAEELESRSSVDRLQGMLQSIIEKSENEPSPEKSVDSKTKEDLKIPVTRMERGSSPINLPAEATSSEEPKLPPPEEVNPAAIVNDLKVVVDDDALTTNSIILDEFQPEVSPIASEVEEQSVTRQTQITDITLESEPFSPTLYSEDILRTKISQIFQTKSSYESLATKDITSIANAVEPSTEKNRKLSIQVMPTVSIRGGLVMQKTLHLSIKPTGSITNNLEGTRSNVGYQEIKVNLEQSQDYQVKDINKGTCPDDCRSPHGAYCKSKSVDSSVLGSFVSNPESKSKRYSPVLDKETLFLYKSFQVLDEIYDDRKRAGTSHGSDNSDATRLRYSLRASNPTASVDSILDFQHLPKSQRTPWQLGFYKTKATQCHDSSRDNLEITQDVFEIPQSDVELPGEVIENPRDGVETPRSHAEIPRGDVEIRREDVQVSTDSAPPDIPVRITKPSVLDGTKPISEIIEKVQIKRPIKEEEVTHDDGKTVNSTSSSSSRKSPSLSRHSVSISSDVTEIRPSPLSVKQVLDALKKDETTNGSSNTLQSQQKEPERPAYVVPETKEQDKGETKSKLSGSSGSSSSSNSSYAIHGSSSSSPRTPYRSQPSDDIKSPNSIKVVKGVTPNKPLKSSDNDDKSNVKSETDASPSTKSSGPKVDMSIQVSLGGSSSDDSSSDSSFEDAKERTNTISYFIKGLTGTSGEELAKLRSSPSFPKTELASWSKNVLKTLTREKSKSDRDQLLEVEVENLEYSEPSKTEGTESPSILSERTRMKRLQDLKKLTSTDAKEQPGDKKDREDIVMRLHEHRDSTGEGDERIRMSKRHLPFYRRVLSRIIDPSNKKIMKKSLSEPYPIDESVSEGEISFKSKSHSIGEVNPYTRKYLERKKFAKSELKHFKHQFSEVTRKEFGDKSMRIARQRTQYNDWVTYYLKKQEDKCVDDSGSTSAFSRSS